MRRLLSTARLGVVSDVPVDLYVTAHEPVSFATVVDAAQATMRELLGLGSIPVIEVLRRSAL